VPKCEIFDSSDFHDFYTIKSLWEEDFGIAINFFLFRGSFGIWSLEIPDAYAQSNFNEYFFLVWQKQIFMKLVRPFVSVNRDFLNFSLF
jgi:hypothetical protein